MQESLAYDGDAADSMSSMTSQSERSVISTGDLSLEVDDVVSARDQVVATIEGMGGHVESQHLNGREATSGYLTVRVPAAQFDRAVDSLSEIGTVLNDSRSSQDVTMQHVDLQARVNALEASIDRLTTSGSNPSTSHTHTKRRGSFVSSAIHSSAASRTWRQNVSASACDIPFTSMSRGPCNTSSIACVSTAPQTASGHRMPK